MNTTGSHELMAKTYMLFEKSVSGSGKFAINKAIKTTVRHLNEDHGLEQKDILHGIFEDYVEKECFKKHRPEKTQLATFVTHFTHYDLRNLKRRHDRFKRNYPVIPFDEWPKESVKRIDGSKKRPHEEQLAAMGAFEKNTPEDFVVAKELLGLVNTHYGEDDAKVVLGLTDRQAEAERLSVPYDTYRKRLDRKNRTFRKVLKRAGYC